MSYYEKIHPKLLIFMQFLTYTSQLLSHMLLTFIKVTFTMIIFLSKLGVI
jgi:hypothetical protein